MTRRYFYFLMVLCGLLSSCRWDHQIKADRVCFEESCVNVEVVSAPEAMMKGLQGRTVMAQDEGMLFVFDHADKHLFWMKDTLIPLDMVWMNLQRQIIDIHRNVPPCRSDPCVTYGPATPDAWYVLEVNAGYAHQHGLDKGDQADFRIRD